MKQLIYQVRQFGNLELAVVASQKGLVRVSTNCDIQDAELGENYYISKTIAQLYEYFADKRRTFQLVTDVEGTEFQLEVWNALKQIPYGETWSYQDVANEISRPAAVRAVASAIGRNPLMIVIPCHRVIASSGKLGGFSAGLDVKYYLHEIEGIKLN